jgi:hypothetical protein
MNKIGVLANVAMEKGFRFANSFQPLLSWKIGCSEKSLAPL